MKAIISMGLLLILFFSVQSCKSDKVHVVGELKKWHRVTLLFEGPQTSEKDSVNPFLNYRLNVTFRHNNKEYLVPGYYAADGNAAETSADQGNIWKVHFCPDETGTWEWTASFRQGKNIAVNDKPGDGTPVFFNGLSGEIVIKESDKTGRNFRARGRLQYSNRGYLKESETGEYWIKGGTNSPENLLAYHDFDGTYDAGGVGLPTLDSGLHRYIPHINDWQENDPTWKGTKGKGMIGALNYLAEKGINSQYFIVMNVAGDGQDVWPWIAPEETSRYDVSKLAQWEIVFSHMDSLGILLHLLTQERENDTLLNKGNLELERMLYYRELIARYSHHPGLIWNLGEETTRTTAQIKSYIDFFDQHDPYDHFICIHTNIRGSHEDREIDPHELVYRPLLGYGKMDGVSLQIGDMNNIHADVVKWIRESENAGHRWIVNLDEIGHWSTGVTPDGEGNNHGEVRYKALWGTLLAGGGGVEWYFGWNNNGTGSDLSTENFRSRDDWFDYNRYAVNFCQEHLPFWEMQSADSLIYNSRAYCFAKPGEVFVVYLPVASPTVIDLTAYPGKYDVLWYNPRKGGGLLKGSIITVTGGKKVSPGEAPYGKNDDWVVLIRKKTKS